MDFIAKLLLSGVGLGVIATVLWVGFWSVVVPEVLSVSWDGYKTFIVPVFAIAAIGGPAAMLASYLR